DLVQRIQSSLPVGKIGVNPRQLLLEGRLVRFAGTLDLARKTFFLFFQFLDLGSQRTCLGVKSGLEPDRIFAWYQGDEVGRLPAIFRAGIGIAAAVENAIEGVIVLAQNRIEFVIVAPGTAERQSQERLAGGVDRVLNGQVMIVFRVEAEAARDR